MIAFHVFQAIPFLYELRELLDWYISLALQGSLPCLLTRPCMSPAESALCLGSTAC